MAEAVGTLFRRTHRPPPPSEPNVPKILFNIYMAGAAHGRSFRIAELAALGEVTVESFLDELALRWDELEASLEARRG